MKIMIKQLYVIELNDLEQCFECTAKQQTWHNFWAF